jgi:hypothetical protein
VAKVIQEPCKGGLVVKVVHGFIEGNVLGSLDNLRDGIIVQDVLHGLGEAKEDANTGVRDKLIRATGARRKGIDATAKNA